MREKRPREDEKKRCGRRHNFRPLSPAPSAARADNADTAHIRCVCGWKRRCRRCTALCGEREREKKKVSYLVFALVSALPPLSLFFLSLFFFFSSFSFRRRLFLCDTADMVLEATVVWYVCAVRKGRAEAECRFFATQRNSLCSHSLLFIVFSAAVLTLAGR